MSIKNHPNVNAAGLVVDVIEAVISRVRGNASAALRAGDKLPSGVYNAAKEFALTVDSILDEKFGMGESQ